uniref:Uncharacterized protein n=1 Tax=Anguilla anguilla TaxID=7936 RepID=A0A0E9RJN3_ANGAN
MTSRKNAGHGYGLENEVENLAFMLICTNRHRHFHSVPMLLHFRMRQKRAKTISDAT